MIVVDGLRFRQDRAFMTERFGTRFLHLHIVARTNLRRERYHQQHPGDIPFDQSDVDSVESEVDDLAGFLFGAERPFFVPSPTIRFAERAEGVKGP